MRVRITHRLSGSIDGVQLNSFQVGSIYDMPTALGCYLMALGHAMPYADDSPALIIPLNELENDHRLERLRATMQRLNSRFNDVRDVET